MRSHYKIRSKIKATKRSSPFLILLFTIQKHLK